MRVEELRQSLEKINIPTSAYSIGSDRDESYCVVLDGGRWQVFYSERGNRVGERTHTSEEDAANDLLTRLLGDRIVRRSIAEQSPDRPKPGRFSRPK